MPFKRHKLESSIFTDQSNSLKEWDEWAREENKNIIDINIMAQEKILTPLCELTSCFYFCGGAFVCTWRPHWIVCVRNFHVVCQKAKYIILNFLIWIYITYFKVVIKCSLSIHVRAWLGGTQQQVLLLSLSL